MTLSLAVISVKARDLQPGDQLFHKSHPNFDVAFVSEPYMGIPGPFVGANPAELTTVVTVTFGSGSQQELRADSSLMTFAPDKYGTMEVQGRGAPTMTSTAIRTLAVQTDTELGRLYGERRALQQRVELLTNDVQAWSGSKKTSGYARKKKWDRPIEAALTDYVHPVGTMTYQRGSWERLVEHYREAAAKVAAVSQDIDRLQAIWQEHRWTRAFLVMNSNGHVHRSMQCSTCRPTTWFNWLPEYSGADETEIVSDAGERACTICYPSAPVDTFSRATKIFSEDEKRIAKEREERAAAKAAKDAARAAREAKRAARAAR